MVVGICKTILFEYMLVLNTFLVTGQLLRIISVRLPVVFYLFILLLQHPLSMNFFRSHLKYDVNAFLLGYLGHAVNLLLKQCRMLVYMSV